MLVIVLISSEFECSFLLDVVVMEKNIWAFFECEPQIWIIVAVDTVASYGGRNPYHMLYQHRTSTQGLVSSLRRLYTFYHTFSGTISNALQGDPSRGMFK